MYMQLLLYYIFLYYLIENFPLNWWSDTQSKYHIVESELQLLHLCVCVCVCVWASSSVQVNSNMQSFSNISLFCHLVPFSVMLC